MIIGILFIATGKYIEFFKKVYNSFEKFFLVDHQKIYYLFTDSDIPFTNVNIIQIKYGGFPKDTLYRYHYFLNIKQKLQNDKIDILYYSDVDMRVVNYVDNDILPTPEYPLIGVIHPGFYNTRKYLGTPEKNKNSEAYISPTEKRQYYICGGIQGGQMSIYLHAMEKMKEMIDKDKTKNIIAKWHDESYWNRYMVSNIDLFKFMKPNYCHPEKKRKKIAPNIKILALTKNHRLYRTKK